MPSGTTRRGIVRTAGAEIRSARRRRRSSRPALCCALFSRETLAAQLVVVAVAQQPLADADRDVVRIERALDRKQPVALLVLLADADRLVGGAVELLAHLHFDQRALLLDHDDEVEALARTRPVPAAAIGHGQPIL